MSQGIFTDLTTRDYFADPAPAPSLTQSIAKLMLERSPLHAWYAHPRLNPDFERDEDTKYDVGNIAHTMILGRGKELVVLDEFDDWRKKDAQMARQLAAQDGKLAVLGKHYALGDKLVRAAREQLDRRDHGYLFGDTGNAEAVLVWQEQGIWLRQMVDWLSHDRTVFCDFKTTDESAAPHTLARKMLNDGWHIQAAMCERGLARLDPDNIGRRRYLFVVQEIRSPYCLSIVEISESALTMGRKQLDAAVKMWRNCMASNYWPGYPLLVVVPDFPEWAEAQWLDREENRADPINVLMAG